MEAFTWAVPMMIWVIVAHFATGQIEPVRKYSDEASCNSALALIHDAATKLNVKVECVKYEVTK